MKQNKLLSIFGASGHGKIVLTVANQLGYDVTAFYDGNNELFNTRIHDVPVMGVFCDCDFNTNVIIAIGDNKIREDIADQFQDAKWTTLVHPRSCIDETVHIGPGSLICAGATIQVDSILGMHTIVNTNASVDHDCVIGSFVHIAPGVNLAGNVSVGDGSMIGIGASVLPGIKIGKNSIVGAGSVATRDVPDSATAVGCPARVVKKRD